MKSLFSLFFVLILLPASAQLTYETLYVDYDSTWHYKNLTIFPVRRKGGGGGGEEGLLPLNKALSQGLVTITERGTTSFDNVHWLRFNTRSDKGIYISGGEIIAGGRQDRMIVRDTILQPSSRDQYVPVMCVEEGRWSEKEKKIAYGNFANPHLRRVMDSGRNQALVWREIDRQLQAGSFKNQTQSYLSRDLDKKYVAMNDEYFNFFKRRFALPDSNIVGFVAMSGGQVIGSDIYDGTDLFYSQLDPLLRGYIDDAVLFGGPVMPDQSQVRKYMDQLLKDQSSQEEFVRKRGKIFRQNGRVIHVNTFVKDYL